jgi:hypothetical protein
MNQVVIQIRGAPHSGKTTALRVILGALHVADLLDESSVKVNEISHDMGGETIEIVTFNAPTAPQCNRTEERIIARGSIFKEINELGAGTYQTDKWGVEADDTKNTPWMWTAYITQYATKWMTGLFTTPTESVDLFRTMMIKVAASRSPRREPRSPAAPSAAPSTRTSKMPLKLDVNEQPETIEDAINFIVAQMDAEENDYVRASGWAGAHFGAGMYMRNAWNLWGAQPDNPKTLFDHTMGRFGTEWSKCPGDDIASLIYDGVTAKLRGEDFDIQAKVDETRKFYARQR